jgi:L-amino acid N-acyltransferase YncA
VGSSRGANDEMLATKGVVPTMELSVRDARPDDAEAIVRILNPIIGARLFTVFDTPFTVDAEREFIINFPTRGIFHVAIRQVDQRLVGFQNLEPFATYTRAFDHVGTLATYVDLEARRQGVARRLFETTFEAARRKGYEKIFTFVRADNSQGLLTYLKQGFRIIGTAHRQAKIDSRYVDEILIEKMLVPGPS